MTLRDVIEQVQADLNANLNSYIDASQKEEEDWFTELSFHADAPDVETDRFFMGIYLSSPDGQVLTSTAQASNMTITLDCILDDVREHSVLPELYLSAVTEYLRKKRYGISSSVTTAQIIRTDLGAPVNAFAVAIDVTVYSTDYDYNF